MNLSTIIAARHRGAGEQLLLNVDTSFPATTLLTIELDANLSYSGSVNWGDGSSTTLIGTVPASISHTFATVGTFQVKVSGTQVPKFSPRDQLSIVSFQNIGNLGLQVTDNMCSACTGMTSVSITDDVTSIGSDAFYFCQFTSITIPDSVTSIGEGAFRTCTKMTSVILPNNIGFTAIEDKTFLSCTDLLSVTIPNSVTSIGGSAFGGAFNGCDSLTSITIPDSVTIIGEQAFYQCTGLTSATIGNLVCRLLLETNKDCTILSSLSCLATTAPTLGTDVFLNVLTTTIDVPIGATGYGATYGGLTVNYVL